MNKKGRAWFGDEPLSELRGVRFAPKVTKAVEAKVGKRGFSVFVRKAVDLLLGSEPPDSGADASDDAGREDPS